MNIVDRYWNADTWRYDDKEWLAERKKEWKHVQNNLKIVARTEFKDSNYLKSHKELFFKGTVKDSLFSCSGDRDFGYMLPFFVVWYHPNISDQEIADLNSWGHSSFSRAQTMGSIREKWDKVWRNNVDKFSPGYGFCGGKEELIASIFWGEPLKGAIFDHYEWIDDERFIRGYKEHPEKMLPFVTNTSLHFIKGAKVSDIYWRSIAHRVAKPEIAKHTIGKYLFDHAMTYDCSDDDNVRNVVAWTATIVLNRKQIPQELLKNDFAVQTLDDVEQLYRDGKFSPSYQRVWEDVESGKIQIKIS